ncbi:MAG: UDP-3-O-(3-hydroxymyristoyl)glucosamine N-acyltransferase [Phycisphaerae bacterium]|nr:UDP-3-O-(3-hydroxymyristoyl)glucosamine N-acyltransferase [Phycisphaerae bacterium]HBZ97393.1 UDP-3-O-(3-hydroxymyristoyl)glucosamine N-acyltransferase [Phycisphaerales bacterium]
MASSGDQSTRHLTAASVAQLVGGDLDGPADLVLHGVDSMQNADGAHLTFIRSGEFARDWKDATAGAALVTRGVEVPGHDPANRALIVVDDAELAMNTLLTHFAPEPDWPDSGIHDTAQIHESAVMGQGVRIGAGVLVAADVELGDGVVLCPGVQIGRGARIGAGTMIGSLSVIGRDCILGCRCQLQPYVSVGADGFGYRPNAAGTGLEKVPQNGTVRIGDDVDLGAHTCVDRAKFGETVIGDGSKLDNMVQVGHNVVIGRNVVIAAQAGMAGSVQVGDWAQIGAQAGIADHLKIGPGARVGAKTGVMRDVEAGTSVLGTPAFEDRIFLRQLSSLRKLPEFMAKQRSQSR